MATYPIFSAFQQWFMFGRDCFWTWILTSFHLSKRAAHIESPQCWPFWSITMCQSKKCTQKWCESFHLVISCSLLSPTTRNQSSRHENFDPTTLYPTTFQVSSWWFWINQPTHLKNMRNRQIGSFISPGIGIGVNIKKCYELPPIPPIPPAFAIQITYMDPQYM